MPTTPRGIVTPNDSDEFDLVTDLAATGVSVDTAIGAVAGTVQYRAGLTSARPAVGAVTKGYMWFSTETNILWRHSGTAWELFGFGPFKSVQVRADGVGTVTQAGSLGPLSGISATTSVTTAVPCRAKISLTFQGYGNAVGVAFSAGVGLTGATTYTPISSAADSLFITTQAAGSPTISASGSWIVSLNAGTTNFSVLGQIAGAGGTRTIRAINLIVEPVSE